MSSYGYDVATGLLVGLDRPNGVGDVFSFDAAGRLTSRDSVDGSGGVVDRVEYTLNDAGLRGVLEDLSGVHEFSYDADGRLVGVSIPVVVCWPMRRSPMTVWGM